MLTIQLLIAVCRYGLSGPFETLSEKQIRQQMEINFFGLLDVTRKAMETMRDLKTGGVIQQVTSIGGQVGMSSQSNQLMRMTRITEHCQVSQISAFTVQASGLLKVSPRPLQKKSNQSGVSSSHASSLEASVLTGPVDRWILARSTIPHTTI